MIPYPLLKLSYSKKINLTETNTFEKSIPMVLKNQIQGIYTNTTTSLNFLQKNNQNIKLVLSNNLPKRKETYSLATIHHPQIIKEFNSFLFKKQKFILTLKKKYQIK